MCQLPQPVADPVAVPAPRDIPYPGTIRLRVDASDVERRILRVRQTIPVEGAGRMTLLFPKWIPGYHAPQAPIELFAGLALSAEGQDIPWKRHPTEVHAFSFDVPGGVETIEVVFQFLSPTAPSQGRVTVGPDLLSLQWNTVLLYPAGYFARQIQVAASLVLPRDWKHGCALGSAIADEGIEFETVPLDVLVDSPVMAGRHFRRIDLDDTGEVGLTMVADSPELLAATPEQIAPHRAVVVEADALFGSRPFDRYEILLALSDEIGSIGVEHHRSCEAVTIPQYFTDWDATFSRRDTIPHEYVHSWNGKHRRGADSWTPSFEQPIRNSLMWVYEGQTQYWDRVLCARSGLWSREQTLGALALTAATYDVRAGSRWRPISDTTRDPIISARSPLPWASWQRSEDYYSEGALVWLDVDTRIRELTDSEASLDDFAKAFFGAKGRGEAITVTYTFEEVVASLAQIAPFEWEGFFLSKLEGKHEGAPLAGFERGGYRLVFKDEPSAYLANFQAVGGTINLLFSLGLIASEEGAVEEVLWEGPAFTVGLTAGSQIVEVNGQPFAPDILRNAVADTRGGAAVGLLVKNGKYEKRVEIAGCDGHRYPDLEPISGGQRRLDDILAPRRAGG